MKPSAISDNSSLVEQLRKRCRQKFLRHYPDGFRTERYQAERKIIWDAHLLWQQQFSKTAFEQLLFTREYSAITSGVLKVALDSNLLLPFEQMTIRHAVENKDGAEVLSRGLHRLLYSPGKKKDRFERFTSTLNLLPRKDVRVSTWPFQTLFTFLSAPAGEIFVQSRVVQIAAEHYGFPLLFKPMPNWQTYQSVLDFCNEICRDLIDLKPEDMIDIHVFIKTQGAEQ